MNRTNLIRGFILALFLMGAVFALSSGVIASEDDADAPVILSAPEAAGSQNAKPKSAGVDKDLFDDSAGFGENFEKEITIKTVEGGRHDFTVELALHPRDQEKGLMFRQSMPTMHGMLFVFGSDMQRSFWMKNTLIPLDIIFLERDGRIQHIHPMAKPQDLTMITSGQPSYAVLELNGGTASKLGIAVGDYVYNTAFRNKNLE